RLPSTPPSPLRGFPERAPAAADWALAIMISSARGGGGSAHTREAESAAPIPGSVFHRTCVTGKKQERGGGGGARAGGWGGAGWWLRAPRGGGGAAPCPGKGERPAPPAVPASPGGWGGGRKERGGGGGGGIRWCLTGAALTARHRSPFCSARGVPPPGCE